METQSKVMQIVDGFFERPENLSLSITSFGPTPSLNEDCFLDHADLMKEINKGCSNVISAMSAADPRRRERQRNIGPLKKAISFFTGDDIYEPISFRAAQENAENCLQEVLKFEDRFTKSIDLALSVKSEWLSLREELSLYIKAGDLIAERLNELDSSDQSLSRRFQRRLDNLKVLHSSSENSILQIDMMLRSSIDLSDRMAELRMVIIPVWRQRNTASTFSAQDFKAQEDAVAAHNNISNALASIQEAARAAD